MYYGALRLAEDLPEAKLSRGLKEGVQQVGRQEKMFQAKETASAKVWSCEILYSD